jgi:L-amino acid N-acyltransferase YncA
MLIASMNIRPATEADRDAIWNIFHEVVATGDTYALDPNISREDALAYWFAPGTYTYIAEGVPVEDGVAVPGKPTASPTTVTARQILGTYILRPNPYEGCQGVNLGK